MSRACQSNSAQPSSAANGSSQLPLPPNQDPDIDMAAGARSYTGSMQGLGQAFQTITIRPKEVVCDLLTHDMVTKKGIVFQFLNSNSVGTTTGVTLIGLNNPRRIPAYIGQNIGIIRLHAVHTLQVHFLMTLCSAGIMETLSPEDYYVSFSWASLSEYRPSLSQHRKLDLGIGYGVCNVFVFPKFLLIILIVYWSYPGMQKFSLRNFPQCNSFFRNPKPINIFYYRGR
jgi:hypothetical protein